MDLGYEIMNKEKLPQNTDSIIYVEDWEIRTLKDLLDVSQLKWGNVDLSRLKIEFEEIQVKCFGYDQYDLDDYRNYFVITLDMSSIM